MTTAEQQLRSLVAARGGYVNSHAHLDRAFTLPSGSLADAALPLTEKWAYVDAVKRASTVEAYEQRIRDAVFTLRDADTAACATFIDVDDVAEDRALQAVLRIRNQLQGIFPLRIVSQTLKGVLNETARAWFDRAAPLVDIIGGLPKKDAPHEAEHLDVLLGTGKRLGKLVHVHVDQFNAAEERETALLAQKTIEHGMEGNVWAVHSISLAAHPQPYRKQTYQLMRDAGLGVIACPYAWIDAPRSETQAPTHNAIAPIDELIDEGIPVALGTDNIADAMKPLGHHDMWSELRLAIEACRLYDRPIEKIVDMVTTNGRKALGLEAL